MESLELLIDENIRIKVMMMKIILTMIMAITITPNTTVAEVIFTTSTMPDIIIRTKQKNSVKLDMTRKIGYLPLSAFSWYCQSLISEGENNIQISWIWIFSNIS